MDMSIFGTPRSMIDFGLKHAYASGMRKADAVEHFGSQRALAAALGITEQAVSLWDDLVPEGRAYQLESITGRKLRVDPASYHAQKAASEAGA